MSFNGNGHFICLFSIFKKTSCFRDVIIRRLREQGVTPFGCELHFVPVQMFLNPVETLHETSLPFYLYAIVSISTKTPKGNSFTANAARAGGLV